MQRVVQEGGFGVEAAAELNLVPNSALSVVTLCVVIHLIH